MKRVRFGEGELQDLKLALEKFAVADEPFTLLESCKHSFYFEREGDVFNNMTRALYSWLRDHGYTCRHALWVGFKVRIWFPKYQQPPYIYFRSILIGGYRPYMEWVKCYRLKQEHEENEAQQQSRNNECGDGNMNC